MKFLIIFFLTLAVMLGEPYSIKGDYQRFTDYVQRAKHNDLIALVQLGIYYYQGKLVKKNYEKSFYYWEKASLLGSVKADYNLGILYSNSKTPYHNYSQAYTIFKELAQKGHVKSQIHLGLFYHFGLDGKIDFSKALYWYQKASDNGSVKAKCYLANFYLEGLGVEKDLDKSYALSYQGFHKNEPLCIKLWEQNGFKSYPNSEIMLPKHYHYP